MAVINRRNEAQKRCNALWIPSAADREELRAARKAVRRAVEVTKEAWMMKLVGEINSRESADDQRPLSPKSSLVNTPQKQRNTSVQCSSRKV